MAKRPQEQAERQEAAYYLRRKTPVRVRRGFGDWRRLPLRRIAMVAVLLAAGLASAYAIDSFLHSDSRFQFAADPNALRISGLYYLQPEPIRKLFESDHGLSLAAIPVEERRSQALELKWIEKATIRRVWPNQLWLHVKERQPVAFVRVAGKGRGETLRLIDRAGVFLEPPEGIQFDLPVITGVQPTMSEQERLDRVRLLQQLVAALDEAEPKYSASISEVNVADPKNAIVSTLHEGGVLELQMGNERFRHRYELFLKYYPSWKQEFGGIRSVDLRFKGHVAIQ
jgi:cell division protein FtsQ